MSDEGSKSSSRQEERRNSSNCSPTASEEDSSFWELYRSGQRSQLNFSEELGSQHQEEEEVVHYHISQLSLSPDNTVFHYVHLDVGEVCLDCEAGRDFIKLMYFLFLGCISLASLTSRRLTAR